MTNTALEQACLHIEEAFRTERKAHQAILLQGHRVKALVDEGRYSYYKACKLMNITELQIKTALLWLIEDNARLNVKYDTHVHAQTVFDYAMAGWFHDHDKSKVVKMRKVS